MIEVTLRVAGVDLDTEAADDVISNQFSDTVWEELDGLTTVTLFVESAKAVEAVIDFIRRLESALEGIKVIGVYRDLVGISDIALRASVSREGARKWAAVDGFPAPFDYIGAGSMKVWAWTEVVDWLESTRALRLERNLPSVQLMTQIENCIMRNPDHTTVQWHQSILIPARSKAVFQNIQPAVRVSTGGRAQGNASEYGVLVGAAANTIDIKME